MKKYQIIFISVTALFYLSACAGGNMSINGQYIKRVAVLKNDKGYGAALIRYRPDGKHIAVTGSYNPFIYIYDVETGERLYKLDKQNETHGTEMSYDGKGKYLVYERDSEEKRKHFLVVRDVSRGYEIVRQDVKSNIWGRYLYPAPDGKIIRPAAMPHNTGIGKGRAKFVLYTPPDMVTEEFWHDCDGFSRFAISPNGKYMADALVEFNGTFSLWDDIGYLRIWKYPQMQLIKTIKKAHKYLLSSLVWSTDSKILYTDAGIAKGINGTDVKLWNTGNWELIKHYQSKEWRSFKFFFLPDNRHLFGVTGDSRLLQLFDVYSNKITEEVSFPNTAFIYTLEQNPVKKNQFAFGYEDQIWIYEIETPVVR